MTSDLELLMTYLSEELPWGDRKDSSQRLAWYFGIARMLAAEFKDLEDRHASHNAPPILKAAKTLVDSWSPNDTVITFNYDTLVEHLWKLDANEASEDDLYPIPMTRIDQRIPSGVGLTLDDGGYYIGFKLLKLHGSVHWLVPTDMSPGEDRLYWHPTRPYSSQWHWSEEKARKYQEGLEPFIIPPVLEKSRFYRHSVVRSQWSKARTALTEAAEVFIIGYSLPAADLMAQMLFRETLGGNNQRVIVVTQNNGAPADAPDSTALFKMRFMSVLSHGTPQFVVANPGESSIQKMIHECPGIVS